MRRFKKQIKQAVADAVANRSIRDLSSGEKVILPKKDISEPKFQFGAGGVRHITLPGNKEFVSGDKIKRPTQAPAGASGGAGNSTDPQEDQFDFQINHEEFLDVFFDDLELPNLIKTQIQKSQLFYPVRAGVSSVGVPANIHIIRSMKSALARRRALGGPIKKKIAALTLELEEAQKQKPPKKPKIDHLLLEIQKLKNKLEKIPFIDPFDLKYTIKTLQPRPNNQAVMFCLMDVSGSMDELKKDIAKKFFILLYLFLNKNYQTIDLVFIRHHTVAKEVDEQEFFYSRETGGTVVSTALEIMQNVIKERYNPLDWNIYGAQASDGDNWNNDSPKCKDILMNGIMPFTQYFAYVEIMPRHHQTLWDMYTQVKQKFPQFSMQTINKQQEIYLVFRELFKRQHKAMIAELPA